MWGRSCHLMKHNEGLPELELWLMTGVLMCCMGRKWGMGFDCRLHVIDGLGISYAAAILRAFS